MQLCLAAMDYYPSLPWQRECTYCVKTSLLTVVVTAFGSYYAGGPVGKLSGLPNCCQGSRTCGCPALIRRKDEVVQLAIARVSQSVLGRVRVGEQRGVEVEQQTWSGLPPGVVYRVGDIGPRGGRRHRELGSRGRA